MSEDTLNEREFELINIIGADLGSNQRDLSRQLDLSLGLTNMLIKRMIAKGYIRIRQLNKRKVQYILTPKGFSEKMRKSVKYTLKTINSIGLIKERIRNVIMKLHSQGERNFIVLGRSDFALLIEMSLKDANLRDYRITYVDRLPLGKIEGTLLICKEGVDLNPGYSGNAVDLIHDLAENNVLAGFTRG
jgi:predicted transcriptional regulator